jgi:AcrR family transcriptional regulator
VNANEEKTVQRRPGGRSARVRAAVLRAALEELADVGWAGMSFEGVAARAGVHKTTVYRRWDSREELMLDAMLQRGTERVPIPDTGSLRQDLLEYGRLIVAGAQAPEAEGLARAIVSIGDRDPQLADASRRFWAARVDLASQIVERAISRGEIPAHADPRLVVEAMIGAMYFRLLLSGEPLDSQFVEGLADLLARGAE